MPLLEVDGKLIGMQPDIAAYVGKLTGYYPGDEGGERAFDLVLAVLTEITDALTGIQERDPGRKIVMRKALIAPYGQVSHALVQLERLLSQKASSAPAFLAGEAFTVVDLAAWRACGWLSGGILDGVPTDYVAAQFPALYAHHLRISQMPEVQAWMLAHPHNYK